jgi:hypothetical protein
MALASSSINIFPGFKSKWAMSFMWSKAIATTSWENILITVWKLITYYIIRGKKKKPPRLLQPQTSSND